MSPYYNGFEHHFVKFFVLYLAIFASHRHLRLFQTMNKRIRDDDGILMFKVFLILIQGVVSYKPETFEIISSRFSSIKCFLYYISCAHFCDLSLNGNPDQCLLLRISDCLITACLTFCA